jgi:hypothetical protein
VVLPGQKAAFEARYPHLGERGLVVHELGFHPEEQGSLFYRMMLSVGTQGNGKVRTQGRTLIEGIIGNLGPGRDPQRILQELEQAKFKGLNEKAVREQMKLIERVTTREEHLRDHLLKDAPLLFVLESKDHGPEQMLPLEVAIMATLSGVLRDGSNPLRWMILHEMVKQGLHEVVAPYLIENAAQIRHGMVSYYLETQTLDRLPSQVVALATGLLQFYTGNQEDYERARRLFSAFMEVLYREIKELPKGSLYLGFNRASDPRYRSRAFRMEGRPSATWAGGESMSAE